MNTDNQVVIPGSDGMTMILGTLGVQGLQKACTEGSFIGDGSKHLVGNNSEIVPAQNLKIDVARTVSDCSHWYGIVWHSEPYRNVAYQVTLSQGSEKIVFRPDPKSDWFQPALTDKFMFRDSDSCKGWNDAWDR